MTRDERLTFAALALVDWEPEYPGQPEPKLVTWFPGEPEDGLSGFHTKADRDAFHAGGEGPYLRRVTGNTHLQMPFRAAQREEPKMARCYKCGRCMEDGVKVMRPVDPPGTPGRRWACEQHFDLFAEPKVEEIVSLVRKETRH